METISDSDKKIIDLVLKTLYASAGRKAMDMEQDILVPNQLGRDHEMIGRVWSILHGSGWVSAALGFGQSGRISLTNLGIQMMLQYGSYTGFLESTKNGSTKPVVHIIGPQKEDANRPQHHEGVVKKE